MSKIQTDSDKKQKGHLSRDLKYLKMPLLFCFTVLFLNLLSYVSYQQGYHSFLQMLTAQAATGVINLFGIAATRENTFIHLTNAVWVVNSSCTAITVMIIFAAFIAVYKASFKAKGIGLLLGLPVIFTANIARLLLMAVIDKYKPAYSAYFHDYLWQVAFIIMIVFMWIVWTEMVMKHEVKADIPG